MRRDVFQAIADPTRRKIIGLIAQKPLHLTEITTHFDISRPAISKHIKILAACGVLTVRKQGREHFCEPNLNALKEASEWIEQYTRFWNDKLDSFATHLENKK